MVDGSILVAAIGGFSALAGSLVATFANYLNEKSKSKNDDVAYSREENRKWLEGRRAAYIEFILTFSKPFSASEIEEDLKGLTRVASEIYLYGNLSPVVPFSIPAPLSIFSNYLNDNETIELANDALNNISEFNVNYDDLNKNIEINSVMALVAILANLRGLSEIYKKSNGNNKKLEKDITDFIKLVKMKTLNSFMPVFLSNV